MVGAMLGRAGAAPVQQAQPPMPSFREITRQQISQTPTQAVTGIGQVLLFTMPVTGYIGNVWLTLSGTITTGSGTPAANWATYPPLPWALIRRIRMYTSENVELVNCSGWGLALENMTQRRLHLLKDSPSSLLNTNNKLLNYQSQSGALAASTAYSFNAYWRLPIKSDDAMMLALLLAQTLDVRIYVEVTFANNADIYSAVPGVAMTYAINIAPDVEFYSVPGAQQGSYAQPNLRYTQTLLEELWPFNNTGDVIYRPPLGNTYEQLIGIAESSGAQVAPSNISTVRMSYAQTVTPYYWQYNQHVNWCDWYYGIDIPDGMAIFDFSLGSGIPGIVEPRDFLNTSEQTDLQWIWNFGSGLTPTNAVIRVVKKQLSLIG